MKKKPTAYLMEKVTPDGVMTVATTFEGATLGVFPTMMAAELYLETKGERTTEHFPPGTEPEGDFAGKVALVRRGFNDPLRLFKCCGGFGCSPSAMGRAVVGYWLADDREEQARGDRIDRADVLRFATVEEERAAEAWHALPETERFLRQLLCWNRQVEEMVNKAQQETRPKYGTRAAEIWDRMELAVREYRRLWFYVNEQKADFATREIARRDAIRAERTRQQEAPTTAEG